LAQWLWLFDSAAPTAEQKQAFVKADRYSAAEIAVLADQDDFYARRSRARSELIGQSLRSMLGVESMFSAEELAHALASAQDPAARAVALLDDARGHLGDEPGQGGMDTFVFCRVIHSLGAAVKMLAGDAKATLDKVLPGLREKLSPQMADWLKSLDLSADGRTPARDWGAKACETAFGQLNLAILHSSMTRLPRPHNALRSDETIWGRAPARLELGGGWTDTPPYTLEFGGSVINAAVNLNGQPPIHCYGRVISRPVIRLSSIDVGEHVEISDLGQLLDYHRPSDPFALVKACLAISGFSPAMADWPGDVSLERMLREFGGGIELTTLVGIPKGSGLGTSSIIGATVIAVIHRMMGRTPGQRELFHDVLRLEQAMTTGGGWQDQIGGAVGGTKITTTHPGMFPDPSIHYVPNDVLDPSGGSTLLYYTGVTRLAKNILRQVVGGYFNRNRTIMATLAQEHQVARCIAEAMARKDAQAFGHYIDEAWRLQKQLCGDVTNAPIELLLSRIRPHIHGARILGAGSGGFMMMICKSPADAAAIRQSLTEKPINERSRFFDFSINNVGLEVTGC
jgi:galactokinase/mevalonate kinase-like predicted kinase